MADDTLISSVAKQTITSTTTQASEAGFEVVAQDTSFTAPVTTYVASAAKTIVVAQTVKVSGSFFEIIGEHTTASFDTLKVKSVAKIGVLGNSGPEAHNSVLEVLSAGYDPSRVTNSVLEVIGGLPYDTRAMQGALEVIGKSTIVPAGADTVITWWTMVNV